VTSKAAKLALPTIGGWPGTRNTTSSAINASSDSRSPRFVASIHVVTNRRISSSSVDIVHFSVS